MFSATSSTAASSAATVAAAAAGDLNPLPVAASTKNNAPNTVSAYGSSGGLSNKKSVHATFNGTVL